MAVAVKKGLYIVAAKRTPFGKYGGLLKDLHPSDLLAIAVQDALKSANLPPTLIDTVNIGQEYVLSGSSDGGLSPRHAALKAGVPQDKPVLGLNRLCGSGFQAVISSAQDILTGVAQICLAGGTESMSTVPFLVRNMRFGTQLWSGMEFEDHLTKQAMDTYCELLMPETAENLAERFKLRRREVDEYALRSQQRWKKAYDAGVYKQEITPITVKVLNQDFVVDKDEHPRPDTTAEGLAKLPALFRNGGLLTAGNSSGVSDGAGALILASEEAIQKHRLVPLARLVGWSCAGVDPSVMGIGPVPAIRNLLKATNMTLDNIDLIEINETFSAQTLACAKALGLDHERLNVNGGAIAIGHPPGSTGARITVHLVHELSSRRFGSLYSLHGYGTDCPGVTKRRGVKNAIGSTCIGGGQGIALHLQSV